MTTMLMILGWINANPGSASMIAGRVTRYAKLALEAVKAVSGK